MVDTEVSAGSSYLMCPHVAAGASCRYMHGSKVHSKEAGPAPAYKQLRCLDIWHTLMHLLGLAAGSHRVVVCGPGWHYAPTQSQVC